MLSDKNNNQAMPGLAAGPMDRSRAPADASADEDSLRWQKMERPLCVDDAFSIARASEREAWRGAEGAANAVIKQTLESVGVSSKAITALSAFGRTKPKTTIRNSTPGVTPLPLIDPKHDAATPVPVAKLKRRVITSPSEARAAVNSALDAKTNLKSASRPATAASAVAHGSPRRGAPYARTQVFGTADPTLRVTRRASSGELDAPVKQHDHELSDRFMQRHMKQHTFSIVHSPLRASDVDIALETGSLVRSASPVDGLSSPVVIKTLAKAVLNENHRLDPISPRIYSSATAALLKHHAGSDSDEDNVAGEYEALASALLDSMATSRKENVIELAAQFARTADRLRADENERNMHQTAAMVDEDDICKRAERRERKKRDAETCANMSSQAALNQREESTRISQAVSSAQLENSGDEGECGDVRGKSDTGSGLKISGIEGYCNIPGANRGLMSKAAVKEYLESASMLFKEAGSLLPQRIGELLGMYVWSCRSWSSLSHTNMRRGLMSTSLDISQWKTVTGSACCAVLELLAVHRDWTTISLSQHKIGNVAAVACIIAVHMSGYSQLQTLAIQDAGLTGGLAPMAISRLLLNEAGDVVNKSIEMLTNAREAAFATKSAGQTQTRSETMGKLLDPDRNSDIVAVRLCAARWAQMTTALDLQPAACKHLTKLLLKGNSFSTGGMIELMEALGYNGTVQHLDLSSCRLMSPCGTSIGSMLQQNRSVQHLDISWNQLGGMGVSAIAKGLAGNGQLQFLLLQWNGCGNEQAMNELAAALVSDSCKLSSFNLAHNRINGRQGSILAEGLSRNTSVNHLVLDGNPLGSFGSRKLLNAMSDSNLEDADKGARSQRFISMTDCHVGFVDPQMFDPANPGGTYTLDLEDKYSRTVLQNMAVLQFRGNGSFASGSVRLDDRPWSIPTGDKVMQWQPPGRGVVSLTFISNRQPPKESSTYSEEELRLYLTALATSKMQVERSGILHTLVTGESFLKPAQARLILSQCQGSSERIAFVSAAFYRMHSTMPPHHEIERLKAQLTPAEQFILESSLSADARTFTPANASGHYRLDLRKPAEREVAMRLMEIRNAEREWSGSLPPPKGLLAVCSEEVAEKHMRNMTIDGDRVIMTKEFKLPKDGILSLDFTSIRKPLPGSCLIAADFVSTMRALPHDRRLAAAKEILGQYVVTLKQVKHVLKDWLLWSSDRVQLLVLAFARIVEYRGFFQLCDLLTKDEFALLQRRLGFHNIYDPFSSVHYFELNLSHAEHREIVAHIVRLAVLEPGDNVIDAWFCGLRFEIPAGWCQRLPKEGMLTLFYCREQGTIDKLVESEHPDSLPSNYKLFQPAGTEWCIEEKKFQIKAKLQAVFPTAEDCFRKLDTDGGGSLDRSEISRGLRDNGIWLFPDELIAFLDWLDKDGGGEVEIDELEEFWNEVKVKYDEDYDDYEEPNEENCRRQREEEGNGDALQSQPVVDICHDGVADTAESLLSE